MFKAPLDLSVIIVSYKALDMTISCIDSVYQNLTNKISFEVICFDNHSEDGTAEVIRKKFPQVVLIENKENIGFARANNRCFEITQGKNVLLLNNDAYLKDDSLLRMLEFLRSSDDIAVVGGKLIYPDKTLQISYGYFPTFLFNNFFMRTLLKKIRTVFPVKKPVKVDWVSGAYFLIKKEVLDDVGFFDERFWMYYEEIDLCARIRHAGYKIYYYPESVVVHEENSDFSSQKKELRKKFRKIFYEKYYGRFMANFISLFDVK